MTFLLNTYRFIAYLVYKLLVLCIRNSFTCYIYLLSTKPSQILIRQKFKISKGVYFLFILNAYNNNSVYVCMQLVF